ncbi:hypothetical protein ACFXO9_31760 [Nocardia tengchongensis]|uniref:hypothetical protein n=1 Tax=Nocardia tengchongensis TaxID=2055889 RepID=UPI0036B16297
MSRSQANFDRYFAERARANSPVVKDPDNLTEREYLRLFAARPGMYIGYTCLRGVTCYLDGYDQASRRLGGPGLDGFREWLMANYVGESSFTWSAMIKSIALPDWDFQTDLTTEQELHALVTLFDLLDKFLEERERTA